MKITLYMAITADGFIATKDGDSEWVSEEDGELFEQKIREQGCLIVGNKTFTQYYNESYPINGVPNIVLSKSSSNRSDGNQNVYYVNSPESAVNQAERLGIKQALLIGGGITNGAFLEKNLIHEIILSYYPLVFGEGIRVFENNSKQLNLEPKSRKDINNGIVQFHYIVKK